MAGSVNKVILVGNLGRDPEIKDLRKRWQGRQIQPRDIGHLERPCQRRAQGKDRMAQRRHL